MEREKEKEKAREREREREREGDRESEIQNKWNCIESLPCPGCSFPAHVPRSPRGLLFHLQRLCQSEPLRLGRGRL